MSEPRVYVIGEDRGVRDALARTPELRALRPALYAQAARFLAECSPDLAGCIVLDLDSPGAAGLQAALAARGIRLPTILLTTAGGEFETQPGTHAAERLAKPVDGEQLLAAIRRALERNGGEPLDRAQAASIAKRMERLTGRERQVLSMVTEGKHNREIAAQLGISPRTVEVYKSRMMEKLQVRRLPELLALVHASHLPGAT